MHGQQNIKFCQTMLNSVIETIQVTEGRMLYSPDLAEGM
jgi:hypothetical protein